LDKNIFCSGNSAGYGIPNCYLLNSVCLASDRDVKVIRIILKTSMGRLADLDNNYKKKAKDFSDEEKVKYCYDLIDRFQNVINKNRGILPKRLKDEFADLINAAQEEIKEINNR